MKIKPSWIVTVAIMLLLASNTVAQPSLSVGSTPGYPGAAVSVQVHIARATNLQAAQFEITFDTNRVRGGPALPIAAGSQQFVRSREVAPGRHRVVAYSLGKPLATNRASVARLPFIVAPSVFDHSGPIAPTAAVFAATGGIRLESPQLESGRIFVRPVNPRADGIVDFFLPSEADKRYLIQATTNFVQWDIISTNVAFANFMELVDWDAPNYPHRFYRSLLYDAAGEIHDISRAPDGGLSFGLHGLAGREFIIQASGDLEEWTDISTNVVQPSGITFSDPDAQNFRQRFYRLKSR